MSLEGLKAFFEIGGVVLLAATFIFGAGALFVNGRINRIASAQLEDFKLKFEGEQQKTARAQREAAEAKALAGGFERDIATANKAAAEANERAAKAQASLGLAEQHAAEANTKAEGFRRDIAIANVSAASANETAERERLARLQLEAKLADRVLTADGQAHLAGLAREFPNGIHLDVCIFGGTLEVANIARAIIGSLNGWTIRLWRISGGAAARGTLIATSPSATDTDREAAQRLIVALNSAGIGAENWKYDDLVKAANSGMRNGPGGLVDAPILMVIGTK